MKLCLIGGTFDPPHWGHALLAETLRTQLRLDSIIFVPAHVPPHKEGESISSPEHRITMLEHFCATNPHFQLDQREIRRQGVSYTIDTIRELKNEQDLEGDEIGFLMGADNYRSLKKWKESDRLVRECTILVTRRPNYPLEESLPYAEQVTFLDLPRIEISSSMVRERVARGDSIRYYVTPEVQHYIEKFRLYLGEYSE